MIDLGTIWFLLWGLLWAIYFVLDGFDLGMGSLLPFVAKNERERRTIYNAAGPFWDGNEVWLITAGGVTFAAFPGTYAVMFSGLYTALMLLLFAIIIRAVSFEFRGKEESQAWRKFWDGCQFLGSFVPALLLGVAFANIFRGLPLGEGGIFQGGLLDLLNPYGLAGGVLFVLMFMVHGGLWLAIKSEGELHERACRTAVGLWPVLAVVTVAFLVYSAFDTELFANYLAHPALFVICLVAVGGLLMMRVYMGSRRLVKAWTSSAVFIGTVALFGVVGIYPNLLPSRIDPAYSMTIANSSSSQLTLTIMLGVTLVFVPIVIVYQAWVYRLFKHKITEEELAYEEAY